MPGLNGHQGPLAGQDFNHDLKYARETGDFRHVIDTARRSHHMLVDFRDAVHRASYVGKDTAAVAMGLNFLENMISQSQAQLSALKQTEKQTQEAIKMATHHDPEKPAEPTGDVPMPPEVPPTPEAA